MKELAKSADMEIVELAQNQHLDKPPRIMTIAVFGQDPEGNQIEIGRPTYISVPKGCKVIIRCRSSHPDEGYAMYPFEFDSEITWARDIHDPRGEGYGLWGIE